MSSIRDNHNRPKETPPHVPDDLLAYLKRTFRPRPIRPGTQKDQIFYESGQLSVVEHLVSVRAKQVENALKGTDHVHVQSQVP